MFVVFLLQFCGVKIHMRICGLGRMLSFLVANSKHFLGSWVKVEFFFLGRSVKGAIFEKLVLAYAIEVGAPGL